VKKGQPNGHVAVIYTDLDQRDRLIEGYIRGCKKRWGSLTVFSARCGPDAKLFRGKMKKAGLRGLPPPVMVDVVDLLKNVQDPSNELLSIIDRAHRGAKAASPALIVGDWAHAVYDRFEVMLAVEREERGALNHICCYRGEGFWSLAPEQIAEVCELHDRVLLQPTVPQTLT
jgi:hypothetical protein